MAKQVMKPFNLENESNETVSERICIQVLLKKRNTFETRDGTKCVQLFVYDSPTPEKELNEYFRLRGE